ncbi:hypothetical protein NQ317_017127 [Molorchus minor]|uniref:Uncharacterized protein n=1 Tax=Molorchus minor TaxID=1323400 RepID=A0ABQ9JH41_9CUCU|nr:hypothetical protein NQ317_017127 [Molorchus minor]
MSGALMRPLVQAGGLRDGYGPRWTYKQGKQVDKLAQYSGDFWYALLCPPPTYYDAHDVLIGFVILNLTHSIHP